MTEPTPPLCRAAALDAEWARIDHLLALAEAARRGETLDEAFSAGFAAVADAVRAGRGGGAWIGLAEGLEASLAGSFLHLDLDLLALALAPDARPGLGQRLHALQPQSGTPYPGLALLEELLMLQDTAEVAALYERLGPTAPLAAARLIQVAGDGPYQMVRATPLAQRLALGYVADLAPPPGAHPQPRRGRWADLVLPEVTLRQLRDFAAWLRHGERLRSWGVRSTGGPLALFSGGSGTGKSFAASVIAAELSAATGESWALYTLDLGRVMSKYVGETEENINRLLDALDGRRAILQVDEADGLLGKRGEVTDARDRYANLEVSHLLSRFERHDGPVILTSNMRANIDAAFLRRFQMVVDFPAPDAAARAMLWARLLPPGAPRDPALNLDELADAVRLSGGSIQNAAHYAAVLAAEAAQPLAPAHLARAVWAELGKESREVRRSEIGALAHHLEDA